MPLMYQIPHRITYILCVVTLSLAMVGTAQTVFVSSQQDLPAGTVTNSNGQILANLNNPASLIIYKDQLYIADYSADRVVKASLDLSTSSTYAQLPALSGAFGLAFD